jgi:hypothetical protein
MYHVFEEYNVPQEFTGIQKMAQEHFISGGQHFESNSVWHQCFPAFGYLYFIGIGLTIVQEGLL